MTYTPTNWVPGVFGTEITSSRLNNIETGIAGAVPRGNLGIRISDYAVGDGTTDDTAAVQAAIDACESTGQELIVNGGKFKITSSLTVPAALTIRGMSRANGGVFTTNAVVRNSVFETYIDGTVFIPKGTSPQVTRLTINGVEFANKMSPIATYGPSSVLFGSGITLQGGSITRCTTSQYGTVFAGKITGVSDISNNYFMTIWAALTANDIVDSRITCNYISGQGLVNATGITVTASTTYSRITNNFIEFMKYGIKWTGGSATGNIIAHNQFDYCYRGIGTVSVAIGATLVTDNVFHACKSASGLSYFTNPDSDMTSGSWMGIEATNGVTYTKFGDNLFEICDVGWKARGYPYIAFESRGNKYKTVTTQTDYSVTLSGNPGDQTEIFIQELDRQAVSSLPSAAITGGSIVSFDRQILFLNGKLVFNNAGAWLGAGAETVDVFTASGSYADPTGASKLRVIAIGPGGGGGGGRRGAAGSVRCGGGGGGGGARSEITIQKSLVTFPVTVTVGTVGSAGTAATADDTSGGNGGAGTSTSFGAYARAAGGSGGFGGTNASGVGGAGGAGRETGGTGATASASGGVGTGPAVAQGPVGGASGGGITSANAANNGGAGIMSTAIGSQGYAGGIVDSTLPVAAPAGVTNGGLPGGSGGGGAASITTTAQDGRAGGNYGAGGSGGGASLNGNNSGAGGAGGAGIVVVVSS